MIRGIALLPMLIVACALIASACGGDSASTKTPTARATASADAAPTVGSAATAAPASPAAGGATATIPAAATNTPVIAATATPAPVLIDPCTTRLSLEGQPLTPGVGYTLDPLNRWKFCNGGGAAGSSEKLLFRTATGGTAWTLVSKTTLGNPPPEPGVGALPNAGSASVLLFQNAAKGWLGLGGAGKNFFRSADGGVTWTEVTELPPAVPVTSIEFTTANDGKVITSTATWVTTDGGVHWTETP